MDMHMHMNMNMNMSMHTIPSLDLSLSRSLPPSPPLLSHAPVRGTAAEAQRLNPNQPRP